MLEDNPSDDDEDEANMSGRRMTLAGLLHEPCLGAPWVTRCKKTRSSIQTPDDDGESRVCLGHNLKQGRVRTEAGTAHIRGCCV